MKIIFGFREFVFFSDQELKLFKNFLLSSFTKIHLGFSITLEQSSISTLTKWQSMFFEFCQIHKYFHHFLLLILKLILDYVK